MDLKAARPSWHNGAKDRYAVKAAPIYILLLAVLRHIGCAWTVDDLHDALGVLKEKIQHFIHTFLKYDAVV
jgi:hypothetical protein